MMKRVLVISEAVFLKLYRTGLEHYANTHDDLSIDIYCLDVPKSKLGLFDRVRYKLDLGSFKKKYYDNQRAELCRLIEEYDQILFINLFYDDEYFIQGELQEALRKKDCRLYFVDTVKSIDQRINFLDIFRKVYSFEKDDIKYLKDKFGITSEYLPVGTSYKYFINDHDLSVQKDIDVCFVGISSPKRLEYLTLLTDYCSRNNRNIFVAGHFWHNNNWLNYTIGKYKFTKKHPLLAKYVKNMFIQPAELAKLYCRSKIVLNINVVYHKSPNQRNFDVMVCDSLLITDKQEMGGLPLEAGKDFIMTEGAEEMLAKVRYYLEHEDERQRIADSGRKTAEANFLYEATLDRLLSNQ